MSNEMYSGLINVICFIGWSMILLPAVVYLFTGWEERRERIFTLMDAAALKLYYAQFFPSVDLSKDSDAALLIRFKKKFCRCFGRRNFIIPLSLLALVAGIGAWGTAESVRIWQGLAEGKAFDAMTVSAFMGAFVWVVGDQIGRYRSRDFARGDVYNCVFRFLIAVPFGYSMQPFLTVSFGIPVAFLLGAFPTGTLFTIARRLSGQKLGLGEEAQAGKLELEELQCLTRTNAERFHDEGISTIAELAWADPVDLSIRTNRDFNYVMDSMSQALMWIYFGVKSRSLYGYSLRGAQEVAILVRALNPSYPNKSEQAAAAQTLADAAKELNMSQGALFFTLLQVEGDPYTKFLVQIWSKG